MLVEEQTPAALAEERPQAALPPPPEGDEQSKQVTFAHEQPATASVTTVAALAAAAALAACGGGGGAEPAPPSPPPPPQPTRSEAARFLGQASFAATDADIARVQAIGYSAWLDEQFNLPRSQSHSEWLQAQGYVVDTAINSFAGVDNSLWRKLISSPDALRQRLTLALSEIFVTSMLGLPIPWRGLVMANYVDTLEANVFGTYRALLEAVTLSPGMGLYLNMRGNQKADTTTGRVPDENYAREVLQLFSIGLIKLDNNGAPLANPPEDSYTQETITNLAKVFTGWDFDGYSRTDPSWTQRPMALIASRHDSGSKTFFDTTIAEGTDGRTALTTALNTIANHANVGPFLGRQLIQRLVASNPSSGYVGRVAAAFNNNGSGVRGDMKAVIKAVLLDEEARRAPDAADTRRGKLREPVQRFVQWARTFNANSPTGLWNIGNLSDPATRLGQSPLRSPSVFNFFRPGYVPPNSALGTDKITAPEFQITNESTVVGWANFAQGFVAGSVIGEARPDYSAELALAGDATALVQRVLLMLAADGFSAATVASITAAVGSIDAGSDTGRRNRVYAAVHLVLCAPEYLVQI